MDPALQMGTDAPSTLVVHRGPGTVSAHGSPGTAPWLPAVALVVTCTVLYTPQLAVEFRIDSRDHLSGSSLFKKVLIKL